MRKSAPVAFLLSGFLVFGAVAFSVPAYADDDEDEETSEVVESPSPLQPKHKKGEEKRKELEEKYGKQGRLSVPPLIIRPKRDSDDLEGVESSEVEDEDEETQSTQSLTPDAPVTGAGAKVLGGQSAADSPSSLGIASTNFIAINPMTAADGAAGGTGRAVNPQQNTPIDISKVRFTRKTPAEVFIQASQVGLYAMAAGAIVLGLIAASRAIRRK
jgi:hypothetical protein